MTDKSKQIIEFLKQRPAISIRMIEQLAGAPSTTIAQAMNSESRNIPDKHISKIEKVLKKYGY